MGLAEKPVAREDSPAMGRRATPDRVGSRRVPRAVRRVAALDRVAAAGLVLALGVGCTAAVRPVSPPPQSLPDVTDRRPVAWGRAEPHLVVVRQSCRTATLYRHGQWVRTFRDLAFGRADGDKIEEGDKRTPLGLYRIAARRTHARWARFLLIDYPNLRDVERNAEARAAGRASAGTGGSVGIHGSDAPLLNRTGVDWTLGCISLRNGDVIELEGLVPVGTPVVVLP